MMKREAEPILRPKKRHEAANMKDALAAMDRLGSIHFLKTLPQTAVPALSPQKNAYLTLPAQFVRENAHKVEEWVTLRIPSFNYGKSSRPWTVRLCIILNTSTTTSVRFAGGWKHFVTGNGLKMGDSLIFLLKEGVRSEFEVHVFRGLGKTPSFPDLRASSTATDDGDNGDDEEDEEEKDVSNSEEEEESLAEDSDDDYKQSCVRSRVHHRDARNRASTGHGRDGKVAPEQQSEHSNNNKAFPGFRKVLIVSNISRRCPGSTRKHSGKFEFPRDFVRTHGKHLGESVQLQGVHEDSPVFVLLCHICKQADDGHMRGRFHSPEWSRFVKANHLSVGQELQFSLTADSYFKVRVI